MAPAKKKMSPVVPLVIVAALIAVGAGAFFLLSGDDGDGGGPVAVVESFFNAGQSGDCEGAIDLIATASVDALGGRDVLVQSCQADVEGGDDVFGSPQAELTSIELVSETDTNATVRAEVTDEEGVDSNDIVLVKEDGSWRIDITATGPGGGDPSGGGSGGDRPGSTSLSAALEDADPEDIPLAESCGSGDMAACDDLWGQTPPGSNIEAWAESCGGRDTSREHERDCETTFG